MLIFGRFPSTLHFDLHQNTFVAIWPLRSTLLPSFKKSPSRPWQCCSSFNRNVILRYAVGMLMALSPRTRQRWRIDVWQPDGALSNPSPVFWSLAKLWSRYRCVEFADGYAQAMILLSPDSTFLLGSPIIVEQSSLHVPRIHENIFAKWLLKAEESILEGF